MDWYYDGEMTRANYIGALSKDGGFTNLFKGFIYSYKIFIIADADLFAEKMIGLECFATETCMTLCSQY